MTKTLLPVKCTYAKALRLLLFIAAIFTFKAGYAQQTTPAYPRVTGYFSITQPLTTYTNGTLNGNFGNVYIVAFPFGVNLIKTEHFGVSFEIAPSIRTENNISKVSTVVLQPGAMFRFNHGFTLITRVAFETNGRFGFGPVFNKTLIKGKDCSFFGSVPFPVRFGNSQPWSVSTGIQLGVSF
jgi:hypothetical protein